ncbi:hypothetical protein Landi51_07066 [Colletotrichum acutatum]
MPLSPSTSKYHLAEVGLDRRLTSSPSVGNHQIKFSTADNAALDHQYHRQGTAREYGDNHTTFRDKTVAACLSWSGASNYTRRRLAYCVTRFLHLNRAASILIRQKTPDHNLHPHVGHRVGKATSQQPQKRKRLAASDRAPTPMISRILPVSSSLQLGFTVQATRHTKLATRTWCSQATTAPEAYARIQTF